MKDPLELLRSKEQDIVRIKREIEALKIVAHLLDEDAYPANGDKAEYRQPVEMP